MTQDGSAHSLFGTLSDLPGTGAGQYYALPKLEEAGLGQISRLPVCLRIVLESVLRNYDGQRGSGRGCERCFIGVYTQVYRKMFSHDWNSSDFSTAQSRTQQHCNKDKQA